jgi:transcriptional regulator with XRE-family HTH domain
MLIYPNGPAIKKARLLKLLSCSRLALLSGVSAMSVINIEQGKTVRSPTFRRVLNGLEIDWSEADKYQRKEPK